MQGNLCGWQTKNQPSAAYIDVRQVEYIAKESTVCIGICAVDDRVRAANHNCFLVSVGDRFPSLLWNHEHVADPAAPSGTPCHFSFLGASFLGASSSFRMTPV